MLSAEKFHQTPYLQLKSMMEAINTEVRLSTEKNWESTRRTVLQEKGISQLLYGSKTTLAESPVHVSAGP